jgi:hypothetical protein
MLCIIGIDTGRAVTGSLAMGLAVSDCGPA